MRGNIYAICGGIVLGVKRVLIYLDKEKLSPKGGPYGYCYNLVNGLNRIDRSDDIDICFIEGKVRQPRTQQAIFYSRTKKFRNALNILKNIYRKGSMLYGPSHTAVVDLSHYDLVHFQSTRLMYEVRDSLREYKGIVVLTSHAPTLLSREIFDSLSVSEQKYLGWFYKKLIRMDEYSFKRADYIIFPCEDAEEPYYHNWTDYEDIHEAKKDRYRYLLTGALPKSANISKNDLRAQYGIPRNAFVISYVGRHNEIKGYGDLKIIGEQILQEYSNVYFIIAGREEPLKGLDHDHWVEVGWTNDPGSIIAASDMFILPNRETYFDLVMLEVLSLGQVVLASRTGGNKYFERYQGSGILLYDGRAEAIQYIRELISYSMNQMEDLRRINKDIYEREFTIDTFARRYLELLSSILLEDKSE